jgi:hypothetical protein
VAEDKVLSTIQDCPARFKKCMRTSRETHMNSTLKKWGFTLAGSILLFTLFGCSTSYRPYGFNGGYSDRQLGSNIFRISFVGNNSTSQQQAWDFSLLRAADITLEHGFTCFCIIEKKNITIITPTNLRSYKYYHNLEQTSTNLNISDQDAPRSISTSTTKRPTCDLLIHCYKEKPADQKSADALLLQRSLRGKYKIKP